MKRIFSCMCSDLLTEYLRGRGYLALSKLCSCKSNRSAKNEYFINQACSFKIARYDPHFYDPWLRINKTTKNKTANKKFPWWIKNKSLKTDSLFSEAQRQISDSWCKFLAMLLFEDGRIKKENRLGSSLLAA